MEMVFVDFYNLWTLYILHPTLEETKLFATVFEPTSYITSFRFPYGDIFNLDVLFLRQSICEDIVFTISIDFSQQDNLYLEACEQNRLEIHRIVYHCTYINNVTQNKLMDLNPTRY